MRIPTRLILTNHSTAAHLLDGLCNKVLNDIYSTVTVGGENGCIDFRFLFCRQLSASDSCSTTAITLLVEAFFDSMRSWSRVFCVYNRIAFLTCSVIAEFGAL